MLTEPKLIKSKMAVFLKKMNQDQTGTPQKEKEDPKIIVKAGKMINYSKNSNSYFTDVELNSDNMHNLKRELQKNQHEYLYKSLESKPENMTQRQRAFQEDQTGILAVRSEFKGQRRLESIDQNDQIATRHKLYQIPISSNRLREKCDKNGVSFVKFNSTSNQESRPTFSQNFNTYFQFKQFMSKISNETQNSNRRSSRYQNMGTILKNTKKCSIIPALKPTIYKTKKSQSNCKANSSIDQYQVYLETKKTKIKLQKSLVIQSKKQELVTHIISRYKNKIKPKVEDKELKQVSDIKLQENDVSLKIQSIKNDKQQSPRNQSQRVKQQKNISFYFSGHEDGVYEQKIRSYRQLLFLVNLAHRVFDPLVILDGTVIKLEKVTVPRPTYYVGPGNNAMLVRSLMKRRIWWDQVNQHQNANFIWTQLKIPSIYDGQKSQGKRVYDRSLLQENGEVIEQIEHDCLPKQLRPQQKSSKDQMSVDKLLTVEKCIYKTVQNKKQICMPSVSSNIPKGLIFRAPFAVTSQQKILTESDSKYYKKMMSKSLRDNDYLESRLKYLPKDYLTMRNYDEQFQTHNHFQCNHSLGNKKALFYHMQLYYKLTNKSINTAFPMTFHIKTGENDTQFKRFLDEYQRIAREEKHLKNIWILKPGENSNRGNGITVIKQINELKRLLRSREKHKNGEAKTFILQKYIEQPLLYSGRKFDIRHYMIISGIHGRIRAYWYGQGYIRTSSYMFNLDEVNDPMIHLTNDAIQKECDDYGCFEQGNKVSYNQLQKYFNKEFPDKKFDFAGIFAKMRGLAKDAVQATYFSLDPNRRLHNFQVFGLDFMIDEKLDVMLIQVNTNPCLELSSNLLSRIIPPMLQQSFRVTLDALFPPPVHYSNNTRHLAPDCSLQKLQMELIFDSGRDGQAIAKLYDKHADEYKQMMSILQGSEKQLDEVYDNEGEEIETQKLIV